MSERITMNVGRCMHFNIESMDVEQLQKLQATLDNEMALLKLLFNSEFISTEVCTAHRNEINSKRKILEDLIIEKS